MWTQPFRPYCTLGHVGDTQESEMSASGRVFQENRREHTGTWATATQSYCFTGSLPFLLPPASRLFRGSVTYIPLPETRPCRGQAATSAYTRRYLLTSAKRGVVLDLRVERKLEKHHAITKQPRKVRFFVVLFCCHGSFVLHTSHRRRRWLVMLNRNILTKI